MDTLIAQSVFLPVELLEKIDAEVKENNEYSTREEFFEAAISEALKKGNKKAPENR